MAWILIFLGTGILLLSFRLHHPVEANRIQAKKQPGISLSEQMRQAGTNVSVRGQTRVTWPASSIRSFRRNISQLKALHKEELRPAAKLLCECADFLNKVAFDPFFKISKSMLPRDHSGEARAVIFARAYFSATVCLLSEETLLSALESWSDVSAMTEPELEALPSIIQRELILLLCGMTRKSVNDQRSFSAARKVFLLKKYGKVRAANKILKRKSGDTLFEAALWEIEEPTAETAELIQNELDRQSDMLQNTLQSLRLIHDFPWQRILDQSSHIHRFFIQDDIYQQIDRQSKMLYRRKASHIALKCKTTEKAVGAAVMELCSKHFAHDLYRHCGYYLLDQGYQELLSHMHKLSPLRRMQIALHAKQNALQTFFLCIVFFSLLCTGFVLGYAVVMLIPFAAVFTMSLTLAFQKNERIRQKKQVIPRLYMTALPQNTPVLAVYHRVLSNAEQAFDAIRQLSFLQEKHPDPQIDFLLLGDFHDSLTLTSANDSMIVSAASSGIHSLCESTGKRFLYLQRERIAAPGEETCHGRDRTRGALETVLRLIRDREIPDRFAYASFHPDELNGQYRLVVWIGEETSLSEGSILQMAGAFMHPLHKRMQAEGQFRGASIIAPDTRSFSPQLNTAFGRWLHGGEAAFEAADHASGLIDPEPFLSAMLPLPHWSSLCHALLDKAAAGCLCDPIAAAYIVEQNTLAQELAVTHRRTRGLWQLFPLLFPLPGLSVFRHTKSADRAKIRRRVLQTLEEPLRLLLLFYAAFSKRDLLLILTFLLPAMADGLPLVSFSCIRRILVKQMILPCTAFVQVDAFGRAVYRMLISRKKLQEWTPAFKQNSGIHQPSMLLFGINMTCAGVFAFAAFFQHAWLALIPAAFWSAMVFVLPYMEQQHKPV